MFADLRYHMVSLAAVFLSLSVGMLIGGLFLNTTPSETQQRLIRRIQEDLARLSVESDRYQRDFERMNQAFEELLPRLTAQRLKGRRVAVVQTGDDNRALADTLKVLRLAGAEVVSTTTITDRWLQMDDVQQQKVIAQLRQLKPNLPDDFSAVVKAVANGVALYGYNRAVDLLRREGLVRANGDYTAPCRYVVVVGGSSAEGKQRPDEVDRPLLQQWREIGVQVVGVERRDCLHSHVPVYRQNEVPSVDCIDIALGQAILPFLFEAEPYAYGVKESAERVLPPSFAL